jgi:Ca-activated chloride channel family protein
MPRARTARQKNRNAASIAALPAATLKTREGTPVPLQAVSATGRLEGLLFELTVEQRYRNDGERNLEAVFTFPLPLRAVLLGLDLELGGRRFAAQAVARAEATEKYERAIDEGDTAALVEHDGNGLYTVSLGNLGAGETAVIRYRYAELLDAHHGYLRLNVPTVIAPRYGDPRNAGLEGPAVPGVDLLAEYPFDIRIELAGLADSGAVRSPSHRIAAAAVETGLAVTLARRGFLDRDFVLEIDQAAIPPHALIARDGDGYVCVASPVLAATSAERRPLALKILLDCSGSMKGDSITAAKRALLSLLDHLTADDRVSVTRFGSTVEHLTDRLEIACEHNLPPLKARVQRIDADLGGTEMQKALKSVLQIAAPADPQPDVILITDGEVYDVADVVKLAARSRHRLFAIAIGAAPNEALARSLAEHTGGGCEFVGPNDDAEAAILRTFKRLRSTPRTLGAVRWPAGPDWTAPLPTAVFPGDTLHLIAGFSTRPAGELEVTVDAQSGAGTNLHLPVATHLTDGDLLPRLAAARRLASLDEAAGRELAVKYQLATEYTSFVVVAERADGEKLTDLPATVAVPHMLAAGWGGAGSALFSRRVSASVGVAMSVRAPSASADWSCLEIPVKQRRLPEEYPIVEPTIVPDDVVTRLLGSPVLPRTFSDLAGLGIPDELLRPLPALCEREGFAEQAVVEAFLAWLVDQLSSEPPASPDLRELRDRLSGVLGGRNYRALRRELRDLLRRFEVSGN